MQTLPQDIWTLSRQCEAKRRAKSWLFHNNNRKGRCLLVDMKWLSKQSDTTHTDCSVQKHVTTAVVTAFLYLRSKAGFIHWLIVIRLTTEIPTSLFQQICNLKKCQVFGKHLWHGLILQTRPFVNCRKATLLTWASWEQIIL